MNGSLVKWLAEDGETVAAGQGLVVLEAMKMETTVPARHAGTFSRADLQPTDRVSKGQELGRLA